MGFRTAHSDHLRSNETQRLLRRSGRVAAGTLVLEYADTGQNRRPRRLQSVEGYTEQVDRPLQEPARPYLPKELVSYRADRSLLPAEGPGGPEQAVSKERPV